MVHELLHVVLCKELRGFSPELEEYIIAALEPELWKYVSNNPRRLSKWRTAIESKINSPEDE